MKEIRDLNGFMNTELGADTSFCNFLKKSPYTFFSEGVYDYFEALEVFVLAKKDDEYKMYKLDVARVVEHKASVDVENNYYETVDSIWEQLEQFSKYTGILISYRHSNSWNDDRTEELLYITRENVDKIKEEEKKEKVEKVEKKEKVEKVDSDIDIRYLPEEDI